MNQGDFNQTVIVSGRFLLPEASQNKVIEDGALAMNGDTIVQIGKRSNLLGTFEDAQHIYVPHGLIMPGLVNTHAHIDPIYTLPHLNTLKTLLDKNASSLVVQEVAKQFVHIYSKLILGEMIRSGTTSVCCSGTFSSEIARAFENKGMRGWVGETVSDRSLVTDKEQREFVQSVYETLLEIDRCSLVRPILAPYNGLKCPPPLLKALFALSKQHDTRFTIQLAKNDQEIRDCLATHGVSPTQHLDNHGLLGANTLVSHCHLSNDSDIELLAQRNVSISACLSPTFNQSPYYAPLPQFLNNNYVSLGTNLITRPIDADLFSTMNTMAKIYKAINLDPTILAAETILNAATFGGAQSLGAASWLGTLNPGKKADIIILDLKKPHLFPLYSLPSHLVYAARGADVIHSIIDGKFVMKDRVLVTGEAPNLMKSLKETTEMISGLQ